MEAQKDDRGCGRKNEEGVDGSDENTSDVHCAIEIPCDNDEDFNRHGPDFQSN